MKSGAANAILLRRSLLPIIPHLKPFSTSTSTSTSTLTPSEIAQINTLIPRLLSSNHLKPALLLLSSALSTTPSPPLHSLPSISLLTARLAAQPDLSLPMHLLNSLKHAPSSTANPFPLISLTKMLSSAFFRAASPKSAVKLFHWLSRPDFPGGSPPMDPELYAHLVEGFCNHGMLFHSIRVLRLVADGGLGLELGMEELGVRVYRGLLREARVGEAVGLRAALRSCTLGTDGGTQELVASLDSIIANWNDSS